MVDRQATDSDRLETSWKASLCQRDHFDSAYARETLPRKKVDPWVIDFGWRATDGDPSRRPSKIWQRASRIALKLLGSCLSFINPRISPLTIKYECPRLSLLIITPIPKANTIGSESYDVIPC
ncbi:Tar1p [Senna tora]|uniref:Tar1p n=1 Tax=Senna tora TaxID=362788 RepID=A0A834SU70_9FABA|nr:Tar1p [Senna tora]